jgi:hypothetical protein
MSVADATYIAEKGVSVVEVDAEIMAVRSKTGNTLTVRRGDRGTTPAAHTSGAQVLIWGLHDPTNVEVNRWINDGFAWLYPVVSYDVWDTQTTTTEGALRYAVPSTMELVEEIYLQGTEAHEWVRLRHWRVLGAYVFFPRALPAGRALRFHGSGRFPELTADTDEVEIGRDLEHAVVLYAASRVVRQREVLRTRFTGQSALLEDRAATIGDLLGSGRDLLRDATALRDQHKTPRAFVLRRGLRGW